jgi:hypothetical protein
MERAIVYKFNPIEAAVVRSLGVAVSGDGSIALTREEARLLAGRAMEKCTQLNSTGLDSVLGEADMCFSIFQMISKDLGRS